MKRITYFIYNLTLRYLSLQMILSLKPLNINSFLCCRVYFLHYHSKKGHPSEGDSCQLHCKRTAFLRFSHVSPLDPCPFLLLFLDHAHSWRHLSSFSTLPRPKRHDQTLCHPAHSTSDSLPPCLPPAEYPAALLAVLVANIDIPNLCFAAVAVKMPCHFVSMRVWCHLYLSIWVSAYLSVVSLCPVCALCALRPVFVLRSRLDSAWAWAWVCFVFDSCPAISTGRVPETGSFIFDDDIAAAVVEQSNSRLQFISLSSFILGVISAGGKEGVPTASCQNI